MRVRKIARITGKTDYRRITDAAKLVGDFVEDDYIRKIINHTDKDIRVADASGRITIHGPVSYLGYDLPKNALIIEEWYAGSVIDGMIDVPPDTRPRFNAAIDNGVLLHHVIELEDLVALPDGIYLEEVNLLISLDDHGVKDPHPRFSTDLKIAMRGMRGTLVGIELLDPRKSLSTMYANINNEVYTVVPQRFPTPSEEGVRIHIKNGGSNKVTTYTYNLEELVEGVGRCGVRLYSGVLEAKEDKRNAEKDTLVKLEEDLLKRKKELHDEGRREGFSEAEAKYKEHMNVVTKTAEEKMSRAEELVASARSSKVNDNSAIIINALKIVAVSLGIYKLYQMQKKT